MDRRLTWIGFLVLFVASAGCSHTFGQLKVDEVRPLLHKPGVYVFDDNSTERYDLGHLPGATRLAFKDMKASDLPADKDATLIFYCANET